MELLTVPDVAAILKVSRSLVYGLIASGKIPCLRIGNGRGAIRVRQEDLQRFMDGCRIETAPALPRVPRPKLKHLRL
jgi:excisionase family DNA binding protein